MTAARFGLAAGFGFHLLVVGPPASAREMFMRRLLDEVAATRPLPSDWCYVTNFAAPAAPRALELPAGQARAFKAEIADLIADLRAEIPRAFEAAQYEDQRNAITEQFSAQRDAAFNALRRRASELGFALLETPAGIAITPILGGQPISPDAYAALDPQIRARFEEGRTALSADLEATMRTIRDLQRSVRNQIRELDRKVASYVVGQRVSESMRLYTDHPAIIEYLTALQADITENAAVFRGEQDGMVQPGFNPMALEEFFRRYEVNVIVDHTGGTRAPVVVEPNPTYVNLIGTIERRSVFGTLVTDFTMIKAGALLQANGGFLLLDLRDVLLSPFSWNGLKHALTQGFVRIEDPAQSVGLITAASLDPEPIPLRVNVVVLADELLAHAAKHDPDFSRLFKIRCEFQDTVERTPDHIRNLAGYLRSVPSDGLPNLDETGLAALVELAARRAGDQRRLSVELEYLSDVARETMQLAGTLGRATADADAVRQAIQARRKRQQYVPERLQAMLVDRTLIVDTDGEHVGQANGLEVLVVNADEPFGKPVRITARTFAGSAGIVNIDREVELGGPIHNKGVLILNGYLGGTYGRRQPLSLSASIVFEQTYQPVEGDSASLAELFTILSSLADAPLSQSIAVTGSVNQYGDVQAIGGINEKVEGFFDLCATRGLTGRQGVVFPKANVVNLMLRDDVVEAVASGRFHLWPISTVDAGIELLTGVPAGAPDDTGAFPPGTIHGRVAARLAELAAIAREHAETKKAEG